MSRPRRRSLDSRATVSRSSAIGLTEKTLLDGLDDPIEDEETALEQLEAACRRR